LCPMNAALLLALFAPAPQTLTDEVFQIPAKEWRYVDVAVKQVPATVRCEFRVISGKGTVRVELVNAEGLDDWKQGHGETKGVGAYGTAAGFSHVIRVPDDYAVVIDNGGRDTAGVRLRVLLDTAESDQPRPMYVSSERRFAVIAISAVVFLAIVTYSAKKLLTVMRG